MITRLVLVSPALLLATALSAAAQGSAPKIPDLSGNWRPRPPLMSISTADPGGAMRGKEPDIQYTPEALKKLMADIPPTGPFGQPDKTTDPWVRYCEANGPVRIYAQPGLTSFMQLPDKVMILHEVMQQFRIVRLNSTHPPLDDLDPTSWGDSIGRYEGDTFVVDTIGLDGRAWLTQSGHPMSEKAHIIERYRRADKDTIDWTVTIDDPGSYLKPVTFSRKLFRSDVPFMKSPWPCSTRDNNYYTDTLLETAGKK